MPLEFVVFVLSKYVTVVLRIILISYIGDSILCEY